jgi:hypothetical protein
MPQEVHLMYHQHYLPTIGRSAVAATRRRWSRCMLVAVAACMLGLLPGTRPHAQPVPVEDHWMADQKDIIGQSLLRQVVIPGSHDAATYDDPSCGLLGLCWPPIEVLYTQAQSQTITAQLNAGSRYFDLRFSYVYWGSGGPNDFYNFHGTDKNGNPLASLLKMSKVLGDIDTWINQPGHEREIVWLDMQVYREYADQSQSKAICHDTLGQELAQGKVLQSRMLPPNTALTDMSMNEIWALPGHPRIIVTGWSSCTGDNPMTEGSTYANRCAGTDIWGQLQSELHGRTSYGNLVTGAYVLFIQGTPFSVPNCGANTIPDLAPQQNFPLSQLKLLGDNPNPYVPYDVLLWIERRQERDNLNVVAGDFLGDPAGDWPIVQTALKLNNFDPEVLSWTADPSASQLTVSCHNPTTVGPTTMVVYPVMQGPKSPNIKTFTTAYGSPGVQGRVSLNDFPGVGTASDGSFLVAVCTRDGSPLAPPGSSNGVGLSRIVIPLSAFGTLPLLGATLIPGDPVDLRFTCFGLATQPIKVTAYPAAAGPNSPDAKVFDSANGQPTVQAGYERRGNYDVRLDCLMSGTTQSLTVRANAFPPDLSIRVGVGPPPTSWISGCTATAPRIWRTSGRRSNSRRRR